MRNLMSLLFSFSLIGFGLALFRYGPVSSVFEIMKWFLLVLFCIVAIIDSGRIRITAWNSLIWVFFFVVLASSLVNSFQDVRIFHSVAVFLFIAVFSQAWANMAGADFILEEGVKRFCVFYTLVSFVFVFSPSAYIGGRFAGPFVNTNVASGFLALSVVFFLFMIISGRGRRFWVLLLVVSVLMLVLTKGRGGLLAAAVPSLFMLFNRQPNGGGRLVFIRVVAGICFFGVFSALSFEKDVDAMSSNALTMRGYEVGSRGEIIDKHWAAFSNSPVIGAGAVIDKKREFARTSGETSYTDILATSGVLGSAVLLLVILRALWGGYVCLKKSVLFYLLLACLLLSISEGYFVSIAGAVSMILWALLSVTLNARNKNVNA